MSNREAEAWMQMYEGLEASTNRQIRMLVAERDAAQKNVDSETEWRVSWVTKEGFGYSYYGTEGNVRNVAAVRKERDQNPVITTRQIIKTDWRVEKL